VAKALNDAGLACTVDAAVVRHLGKVAFNAALNSICTST
jgi:hypothetical protein